MSNVSDGSTLNNTYCYNAAGNISKKTLADGSYVIYHYSGGTLEYEEHFNSSVTLQEVLKYTYDTEGNVEYLLYKDNNFSNASAFDLYYYVRDGVDNITDIFQLREQSGSFTTVVNRLAAHYEYDPYGNILSVDTYNNDNIGNINPIRYKGYYYDLQTGWYYLISRFYDPEVGCFLNADSQINIGMAETNLYAYCNDNPVNEIDPDGNASYKNTITKSGGTYNITTVITYGSRTLKFSYTLYDSLIRFSFGTNGSAYLTALLAGLGKTLAEAIYKAVGTINKTYKTNFLAGRSIGGINTELQLHFAAYKAGILPIHTKVVDMGASIRGKAGYDSNAAIFEGANAAKILTKISFLKIASIPSIIKDIKRYF